MLNKSGIFLGSLSLVEGATKYKDQTEKQVQDSLFPSGGFAQSDQWKVGEAASEYLTCGNVFKGDGFLNWISRLMLDFNHYALMDLSATKMYAEQEADGETFKVKDMEGNSVDILDLSNYPDFANMFPTSNSDRRVRKLSEDKVSTDTPMYMYQKKMEDVNFPCANDTFKFNGFTQQNEVTREELIAFLTCVAPENFLGVVYADADAKTLYGIAKPFDDDIKTLHSAGKTKKGDQEMEYFGALKRTVTETCKASNNRKDCIEGDSCQKKLADYVGTSEADVRGLTDDYWRKTDVKMKAHCEAIEKTIPEGKYKSRAVLMTLNKYWYDTCKSQTYECDGRPHHMTNKRNCCASILTHLEEGSCDLNPANDESNILKTTMTWQAVQELTSSSLAEMSDQDRHEQIRGVFAELTWDTPKVFKNQCIEGPAEPSGDDARYNLLPLPKDSQNKVLEGFADVKPMCFGLNMHMVVMPERGGELLNCLHMQRVKEVIVHKMTQGEEDKVIQGIKQTLLEQDICELNKASPELKTSLAQIPLGRKAKYYPERCKEIIKGYTKTFGETCMSSLVDGLYNTDALMREIKMRSYDPEVTNKERKDAIAKIDNIIKNGPFPICGQTFTIANPWKQDLPATDFDKDWNDASRKSFPYEGECVADFEALKKNGLCKNSDLTWKQEEQVACPAGKHRPNGGDSTDGKPNSGGDATTSAPTSFATGSKQNMGMVGVFVGALGLLLLGA